MIDYDKHTQPDNVGTEYDDYPDEWLRADDIVVAAICVGAILGAIFGFI